MLLFFTVWRRGKAPRHTHKTIPSLLQNTWKNSHLNYKYMLRSNSARSWVYLPLFLSSSKSKLRQCASTFHNPVISIYHTQRRAFRCG
jgi:hypothetical protein